MKMVTNTSNMACINLASDSRNNQPTQQACMCYDLFEQYYWLQLVGDRKDWSIKLDACSYISSLIYNDRYGCTIRELLHVSLKY